MNSEEGQHTHGFWQTITMKARSVLDDDAPGPGHAADAVQSGQSRKGDGPAFHKRLDAFTTSLSYIGNAVEEGLTVVENRASGIIHETRKHLGSRPSSFKGRNLKESRIVQKSENQVALQIEQDIQLKASRDVRWLLCWSKVWHVLGLNVLHRPVRDDFVWTTLLMIPNYLFMVAMAMAAKAKVLLRELKTIKADLAFAKERCAQLEKENRILRESREMGNGVDDEDLVQLQLETLLVEKARLAHENSTYPGEQIPEGDSGVSPADHAGCHILG